MRAVPPGVNSEVEGRGGLRVWRRERMAVVRREGGERWWITAMERAKSKVEGWWGSDRVSAMIAAWGSCFEAILTRFGDL